MKRADSWVFLTFGQLGHEVPSKVLDRWQAVGDVIIVIVRSDVLSISGCLDLGQILIYFLNLYLL